MNGSRNGSRCGDGSGRFPDRPGAGRTGGPGQEDRRAGRGVGRPGRRLPPPPIVDRCGQRWVMVCRRSRWLRQQGGVGPGRRGQGRSVCFVCDNSNSYRDGGFQTVLDEVGRAVEALQHTQTFFVIFFSDAAYPMFHPQQADALQPATFENKRRLQAWLGTVEMCSGGRGIHDAVKRAAALNADVIYFLSDGEHACVRSAKTARVGWFGGSTWSQADRPRPRVTASPARASRGRGCRPARRSRGPR